MLDLQSVWVNWFVILSALIHGGNPCGNDVTKKFEKLSSVGANTRINYMKTGTEHFDQKSVIFQNMMRSI